MIQKIFNNLLNFVLPNTCISCQTIIPAENRYLCQNCCGKLEPYRETHPWQTDRMSDGTIDNSLSAYWFREGAPIQPLLHAMKYSKMKGIGVMLGKELGKIILSHAEYPFSYIIPVPLHKAKHRDRTFNQSDFIAKGVSETIDTQTLKDGIMRKRFTGTQTRLNKTERNENVKGAFEVNPKYADNFCGKNIILVDDVITTGATILECALSLKKSSAGKIWICSAAYAELKLNVV